MRAPGAHALTCTEQRRTCSTLVPQSHSLAGGWDASGASRLRRPWLPQPGGRDGRHGQAETRQLWCALQARWLQRDVYPKNVALNFTSTADFTAFQRW